MDVEDFDIWPPVASQEDKAKWSRLLARVKQPFVFWPNENVKAKEDHIAISLGAGFKLPKDGTEFRSFKSTHTRNDRWDIMPILGVVWKYAQYEFGFERARQFNSHMRYDFFNEEGSDKSKYSDEEVARALEGVGSSLDVDWEVYGPEPDREMWEMLAVSAVNAWLCVGMRDGEEKTRLHEKEYFAWTMCAKKKALAQIQALRLCHRSGNDGQAKICELPVELADLVEHALLVSEDAPPSAKYLIGAYKADYKFTWRMPS